MMGITLTLDGNIKPNTEKVTHKSELKEDREVVEDNSLSSVTQCK